MKLPVVLSVLKSQMTRRLIVVSGGNILAAALGYLAVLVVSRVVSVSDFGLFSLSLSILVVARYVVTLGTDTGMVTFGSASTAAGRSGEAAEVIHVTLRIQLVTAMLVAGSLAATAPVFTRHIFKHPELATLIYMTAAGTLCLSMLNYLRSLLYVRKSFKQSVALQLLADGTKLVAIAMLFLTARMNIRSAVGVFNLAPLAGVALGFWWVKSILSAARTPVEGMARRLLSYGKWVFAGAVCTHAFPGVGVYMLTWMSGPEAAGLYGLAMNLTYIFPILALSMRSVFLPEVSGFKQHAQFEGFLKRALKASAAGSLAVLPVIFFSHRIIPFFFGERYLASVSAFNLLLASYLCMMIASPIRSMLYSMNRPKVVALVDVSRLLAMLLGCYLLIPLTGARAPALVALVVNAGALVFHIADIFAHLRTFPVATR